MRVAELIDKLSRLPPATVVYLSSDEEGNSIQNIGMVEYRTGDSVVTLFPNGVDA